MAQALRCRPRATLSTQAATYFERFDGVIFDKDGTLLDFEATWNPAIYQGICEVAQGDATIEAIISEVLGFDMTNRTPLEDALIVHGSNVEIVAALAPYTDGEALVRAVGDHAVKLAEPAAHAVRLLEALMTLGLPCAVATNDYELDACAQLDSLNWLEGGEEKRPLIGAVLGCDSGHGAKPDKGMVVAAAEAIGVPVERCAMVGDSKADLVAARAAGCAAAVLVGDQGTHSSLADLWVKDLGELVN